MEVFDSRSTNTPYIVDRTVRRVLLNDTSDVGVAYEYNRAGVAEIDASGFKVISTDTLGNEKKGPIVLTWVPGFFHASNSPMVRGGAFVGVDPDSASGGVSVTINALVNHAHTSSEDGGVGPGFSREDA